MKFVDDAKLKMGVFLRERKERAQEKRARKPQDPPNVTTPLWLVQACKFAAWVATISLMYFLWLYTLDIARDRAASLHITHAGTWIGDLQFWFPHIVGFAIVAFGIPYVAKIAIPTFVSLSWHQDATAKVWSLFIAVAVSLVVIAGTFTVQGHNIMERDRDAAVAVEQVAQGRASIEAEIAAIDADLETAMNNRNAYLAQAASVGAIGGAAEWERSYVAQARETNDPRLPMLERATGAARAAEAAVARRNALRQQLAQSTTTASVQREVVTERTGWIAQTLGWLEGVRAILLSFVMDIVALIMPLIALRLEQARNRQMGVESSGWAPEGLRIEDLREQEAVKPQPMERQREVVTDAETGEELVRVRESKPRDYWRRVKKGKPTRVNIDPDIPPDETGFTDTKRTAVTLGGEMELPEEQRVDNVEADANGNEDAEQERGDNHEPEASIADPVKPLDQPEPSEELFPIEEEYLEPASPVSSDPLDESYSENAENPTEENHEEPREPETRESHLLAARTAAE